MLAGCGESANTGQRTERTPIEARECLKAAGFVVTGGARDPSDTDAPDEEIIARRGEVSTFIAYYADDEDAKRYESDVRDAAALPKAEVQRRGRVTFVWTGKDGSARVDAESCVFPASG